MNFNIRKIFIFTILGICIISINLAVYFAITDKPEKEEIEEQILIDTALLVENFNNIFDNQINYQNNEIKIQKENYEKELVYTSYTNQDRSEKAYELNVSIPYLNINSDTAKEINNEINSLFYKKATDIISKSEKNTIYTVKYKAYVNDNVLSLIISATLKEGENNQRVIMKTYNYNLSSNNKLNINEVLQYRRISEDVAQNKVDQTIKAASEDVKQYQELGYNKYLRNINDDMYKLENTTVYFIGEGKAVYIIYPYGNSSYTSEVDLVVM